MLNLWPMIFATFIQGQPVPKGRPRFTRGGFAYTPKKTKDAETYIKKQVQRMYRGEPLKGPLTFYAYFIIRPPKKPKSEMPISGNIADTDNYVKLLLDALNGLLFDDDKQVVQIHAVKMFGDDPGVIFGVSDFRVENLVSLTPLFDFLTLNEGQFSSSSAVQDLINEFSTAAPTLKPELQ